MTRRSSFRLLHHLPHLLRRAHFEADSVFAELHGRAVTSRQFALLSVVERQPGTSQSEVAREIGLDLNTCSDLVARVIAKGLLVRHRSHVDARSFRLELTEEGRRAARKGISTAAAYQDAVAHRLTSEEVDQLIGLLRKQLGFS